MKNKYLIDWEAYAATARKAAAEGAVLLKNEKEALPLKAGEKISVFGRIQFDYYKSGTGSGGMVNTKYEIGILDALKAEEEISINQELERTYLEWIEEHPYDRGSGWGQEPWNQAEMPLEEDLVRTAAECSDAAVVVIGRTAGEDRDAGNEPGSYLLTGLEEEMLRKVCGAFSRVIVVLNVGNIIDMRWVSKYNPQAVLYVWQGGMEGGNAVADVLLGRVNPCGKLTDTIAETIEDYPSTSSYGGRKEDIYAEDIYVGYRYFETFARGKVVYPFGFGLSYTDFEISFAPVECDTAGVKVPVHVKNTGAYAGKEVVQIYLNPPQGKLGKAVRNLIAFQKTPCLAPGKSVELLLDIPKCRMASYDDSGVTGYRSCYVLEPGTYVFYGGTDVRSAQPLGSYEQTECLVVEKCTEALSPVQEFARIKPEKAGNGFETAHEKVPMRSYDLQERMAEDVREIPYSGDRGYQLKDVYDGAIDMETFVAQLSDDDLCAIVRGEGMSSPKVTPGTAAAFGGVTEGLQRYGIPCGCCSDGPSGIRMDCGTYAFSLPNGTCLACTFDEELNEQLFRFEGAELRKNRIDTLLGPGMNIHRNPLNGRNFEYFSEDPLLTGKIASAQLRGMAGYGVTGTIKHFAANNQEYSRRALNSVVSERALREIYLKGFEIAVKEGKAYSIMTTYGAVNGLWTAGNYDLLTTILRKEWGYDGVVMTDWWAEMNEENQPSSAANTAAMVRSQNDIYMVVENAGKNSSGDNLSSSLAAGTLKRGELQRSASNILKMLMRSPVMDRSLGRISPEEQQAFESLTEEDKVDFDLKYYPIEESLELDTENVNTEKGNSLIYGLQIKYPGYYSLHIKVKIDAGKVAQIPITFFANGKLLETVTLNGTDGKWVELDQPLGVFLGTNNFIKLYFAQSGMQIGEMTVQLTEKLTKSFWEGME